MDFHFLLQRVNLVPQVLLDASQTCEGSYYLSIVKLVQLTTHLLKTTTAKLWDDGDEYRYDMVH